MSSTDITVWNPNSSYGEIYHSWMCTVVVKNDDMWMWMRRCEMTVAITMMLDAVVCGCNGRNGGDDVCTMMMIWDLFSVRSTHSVVWEWMYDDDCDADTHVMSTCCVDELFILCVMREMCVITCSLVNYLKPSVWCSNQQFSFFWYCNHLIAWSITYLKWLNDATT